MISFLSYGAIGLGLALSILSFNLIRLEQMRQTPRPLAYIAIYVYMGFTILLCSIGFVSEHLSQNKELLMLMGKCQELTEMSSKLRSHVINLEKVISKFDKMKSGLDLLTTIKGDKIARMSDDLNGKVKDIKQDLTVLNETIKSELNKVGD
mgnify:CR=1 FL=1